MLTYKVNVDRQKYLQGSSGLNGKFSEKKGIQISNKKIKEMPVHKNNREREESF